MEICLSPMMSDSLLPESRKMTTGQTSNGHTSLDHLAMESNCTGNAGGLSTPTFSKT